MFIPSDHVIQTSFYEIYVCLLIMLPMDRPLGLVLQMIERYLVLTGPVITVRTMMDEAGGLCPIACDMSL
jgi:hypothetical protein